MPWNHENVYRALVNQGCAERVLQSERYVQLYPQKPNCAVLYAPGGQYDAAPLGLNEARDSFRSDVFDRISPAIELVRRWSKGPGKESQIFSGYQIVDWDRFAEALGLEHF
jgi:hypothetical protein